MQSWWAVLDHQGRQLTWTRHPARTTWRTGKTNPGKLTKNNGKPTLWRCISYWKWRCFIVILVFGRVSPHSFRNQCNHDRNDISTFLEGTKNPSKIHLFTSSPKKKMEPEKVLITIDGWNPAPVEVGSFSHYLQDSIHPRWCRISSINRYQSPEIAK